MRSREWFPCRKYRLPRIRWHSLWRLPGDQVIDGGLVVDDASSLNSTSASNSRPMEIIAQVARALRPAVLITACSSKTERSAAAFLGELRRLVRTSMRGPASMWMVEGRCWCRHRRSGNRAGPWLQAILLVIQRADPSDALDHARLGDRLPVWMIQRRNLVRRRSSRIHFQLAGPDRWSEMRTLPAVDFKAEFTCWWRGRNPLR